MTNKKRVGILISGRGTNMQALIEACKDPEYPAEIVLVISNKAKAKGLEIAREEGIPTRVIDHKAFSNREEFDSALDESFEEVGVDLICSAGFMRILTDGFVKKWKNKQLNIHPSLLPSFKGINIHQRVLDSGVTITGCTVHFVREEMDNGPIIMQATVPITPKDTPETIAERVLKAEHKIYPHALKLVALGQIRVINEKVVHNETPQPEFEKQVLFSPALPA